MSSDMAGMIAARLRAAGWVENEPGRWLAPGMRRRKKRQQMTTYSLLTAAQTEITREYYASQRAERERLGLPLEVT